MPNPTEYLKDYGTNDRFVLDNPSVHTMAFLPDTQNAIRWVPTVMDRAIDQFDSEDSSLNLTNIVSLGDVVDNWDSDAQWQASSKRSGVCRKWASPSWSSRAIMITMEAGMATECPACARRTIT